MVNNLAGSGVEMTWAILHHVHWEFSQIHFCIWMGIFFNCMLICLGELKASGLSFTSCRAVGIDSELLESIDPIISHVSFTVSQQMAAQYRQQQGGMGGYCQPQGQPPYSSPPQQQPAAPTQPPYMQTRPPPQQVRLQPLQCPACNEVD